MLQTNANAGELEQRARNFIDQARKDLAKLDPRAMARESKEQYDQANRFIALATNELAIKNLVRAAAYAENAAALAGQLAKGK